MVDGLEFRQTQLLKSTVCVCRFREYYTRSVFLKSQVNQVLGWRAWSYVVLAKMASGQVVEPVGLELVAEKVRRSVASSGKILVDMGYAVVDHKGIDLVGRRFGVAFHHRPPKIYTVSSLGSQGFVWIDSSSGFWLCC